MLAARIESASLEAQALEVVPEDLDLISRTFPVGDVERTQPAPVARLQLVGDDFIRWRVTPDVDLCGLDEGEAAQHRFFVERAFFLAFPVEREVRVHLLFIRTQRR